MSRMLHFYIARLVDASIILYCSPDSYASNAFSPAKAPLRCGSDWSIHATFVAEATDYKAQHNRWFVKDIARRLLCAVFLFLFLLFFSPQKRSFKKTGHIDKQAKRYTPGLRFRSEVEDADHTDMSSGVAPAPDVEMGSLQTESRQAEEVKCRISMTSLQPGYF